MKKKKMTPYLNYGLIISNLQQSQRLLDRAIANEAEEEVKTELENQINTLDQYIVYLDSIRQKYKNTNKQ